MFFATDDVCDSIALRAVCPRAALGRVSFHVQFQTLMNLFALFQFALRMQNRAFLAADHPGGPGGDPAQQLFPASSFFPQSWDLPVGLLS